MDAGGTTLGEQQIAELSSKLAAAGARTAETAARLARAQGAATAQAAGSAEVLQSEVVRDLRRQQAEVTRREAELLARYGAKHPAVLAVTAERRDVERQIASEIGRIVAGIASDHETARASEALIAEALDAAKGRAGKAAAQSVTLRELQREAEATRALFNAMLARLKESDAAGMARIEDARIVAAATTPERPSGPNLGVGAFAALLLGALAAAGCALAAELADGRLHDAQQLRRMGLPALGTARATAGGEALASAHRAAHVVRALGMLPKGRVLLVAGVHASPEGTARGLAEARAAAADAVLWIGQPGEATGAAAGSEQPCAVPSPGVPGLVVLAPERVPRALPALRRLVTECRERFDLIVVSGTDFATDDRAPAIADEADRVVLVALPGVTRRAALAAAVCDGIGGSDKLAGVILAARAR